MEPDNNREASDRHSTYQSNRELSPIKQSAWDSLEQSRHYLSSASGAIEELTRTLEAFESRRRKRAQHELAVGEAESIFRTEEIPENRIDVRTTDPVKEFELTGSKGNRTAKDGNTYNPNDDNGSREKDTGVDVPDISEQTKPNRIIRRRSSGLEL